MLRCGGAVGRDGLIFAAELGVEVAAHEVENGIGGIFFFQGRGDFQRLLVFLVVVMEADREVKAGLDRSERAFENGVVELADAFLFAAAGNAHEEAEHFRHRGECVGVVVVQAETEVGVGEIGIEGFGADESLASADAVASGGLRFTAKTVEAREERIAHAGVEVHVGGRCGVAGSCDVVFGQLDDFGGELEIGLVPGEFGATSRVRHAVLVFGGSAPDFPADRFVFKEVADGVVRAILLEFVGRIDGGSEIAGIDLVEDGLGGGGDVEVLSSGRAN